MTESVVDMSDNSDFDAALAAPDRPYTEYDRGYDDGFEDGYDAEIGAKYFRLKHLLRRFRGFAAEKIDAPHNNPIWAEVAEALSGVSSLSSNAPDNYI